MEKEFQELLGSEATGTAAEFTGYSSDQTATLVSFLFIPSFFPVINMTLFWHFSV
jgi:hypothetical protein